MSQGFYLISIFAFLLLSSCSASDSTSSLRGAVKGEEDFDRELRRNRYRNGYYRKGKKAKGKSGKKGKKSIYYEERESAPIKPACYDVGTTHDLFINNPKFDTLATVIDKTVTKSIMSDEEITVFAPTDDAFDKLAAAEPDLVSALLMDDYVLHLRDLLFYHVVPGTIFSGDLSDKKVIATGQQQREELVVDVSGKNVNLLTTLVRAGDPVFGPSRITDSDIETCNGVVHVVDEVLVPSWVNYTVLEQLQKNGQFSTLRSLVAEAGLNLTNFAGTIFAPTNQAFRALGSENMNALLATANTTLVDILGYHLVDGIFPVPEDSKVETLSGFPVFVTGEYQVNNINIQDIIFAGDGIIYELPQVLSLPFTPDQAT